MTFSELHDLLCSMTFPEPLRLLCQDIMLVHPRRIGALWGGCERMVGAPRDLSLCDDG